MPIPLGAIAVAAAASVSSIPVNSYQAVVTGNEIDEGAFSTTSGVRIEPDPRAISTSRVRP